jgi:hypothetical protein
MNKKVKGVAVKDVEADEMWGFVGMKKMTKLHKEVTDPTVGDAYTFVGRAQYEASAGMASWRPRRSQHRGFH